MFCQAYGCVSHLSWHANRILCCWITFQTPTKLYLIVDFVSGGELYFHLRNRGKAGFSEKETQFFLAELALALGCLHSLGT